MIERCWLDGSEDGVELIFEVGDAFVVDDVMIGDGDGAAFFHFFDFAVVAFADGVSVKGALGTFGDAFIAEGFRGDDGDNGQSAGEFMLEGAIFGPRIDAVDDDLLLTGSDEVFSFGDSLASNPILTFGRADHFAKGFFAFAVRGAFDATFGHFLINHVAEVDLGETLAGEIVDSNGFASAAHADDGD